MSDKQPPQETHHTPVPASQPLPPAAPPAPVAVGQPPTPVTYAQNPGETLGIIGLMLNIFGINIGGLILGVLSRNKSKAAGYSTTLGTVSMVWGIIATALGFLAAVFFFIMLVVAASPGY